MKRGFLLGMICPVLVVILDDLLQWGGRSGMGVSLGSPASPKPARSRSHYV